MVDDVKFSKSSFVYFFQANIPLCVGLGSVNSAEQTATSYTMSDDDRQRPTKTDRDRRRRKIEKTTICPPFPVK